MATRKQGNAIMVEMGLFLGGVYRLVFKHFDNAEGGRERLYIDGRLVGSCGGCGYDMRGTCLAEFISNAYAPELKALWKRVKDLPDNQGAQFYRPYGMYRDGHINGACGLNCMIEIAGLIGLEIWWNCETRSYWIRKGGENHV